MRFAALLALAVALAGCPSPPCSGPPQCPHVDTDGSGPPMDVAQRAEVGTDAAGPEAAQLDAGTEAGGADAAPGDAGGQCGPNGCFADWYCRERQSGVYGCVPPPDAGSCPGGWQFCSGECWTGDSPQHCGSCNVQCSSGQTCGYDDGGINFACMP